MTAEDTTGATARREDAADRIIEAGYRLFFDREPDPQGIVNYRSFLGDDPLARLSKFMQTLMSSPEASLRFRDGRLLLQLPAGVLSVAGSPIDRVISLGSRCTVAQKLQDMSLRSGSMPFDWIFSTPEIIVQCLEDDFSLFLRRDQFEKIPVEHRAVKALNLCDHITYRDQFGQKAMFNHRDPTETPDYDYLERCVERFRSVLKAAGTTLFILVTDNHQDPESAYLRLWPVLDRMCSGKAALLFVNVNNQASDGIFPWVREHRRDGEHKMITFDAVGTLGGTRFDREVDEMAIEALIASFRLTRREEDALDPGATVARGSAEPRETEVDRENAGR